MHFVTKIVTSFGGSLASHVLARITQGLAGISKAHF